MPFLVAAHWRAGRERQFERVARLGSGVISISDYPDEYSQGGLQSKAPCVETGTQRRRPGAVVLHDGQHRALMLDECAEEADRFLNLYYGMNMWGDRWGPYGPSELIAERIRRYEAAGAETMVVRFASFDHERQLSLFLEEIVPEFN